MLDETRALGVSNEQPPSVSSESHEVLGRTREQSVEESSSLSMTSLLILTEVAAKVAEATEVFKRNDLDRSSGSFT
jgi:hypothetical protein